MAENESANLATADEEFTDAAPPFEGGSSADEERDTVEVGLDDILDEPDASPPATESKPKGGEGAQAEGKESGPPKGKESAPDAEPKAEDGKPDGGESPEPEADARPAWDKERQRLQMDNANLRRQLEERGAAKSETEPEAPAESPVWEGEVPPLLTAEEKQAIEDGTADYTIQRKLAERQEYDSFRLTALEARQQNDVNKAAMNQILNDVCAEVGEEFRNEIVSGLRQVVKEEGYGGDNWPTRATTKAYALAIGRGLALTKAKSGKPAAKKSTKEQEEPKTKPDTGARGSPVADIDGEPAGNRPMDYLRWAEKKAARLNKAKTG